MTTVVTPGTEGTPHPVRDVLAVAMERPRHLHSPRLLLRCPELWGPDRLHTRHRSAQLMAEANRAVNQDSIGQRQLRRYGCQKAETWSRYRSPWLFSRTSLRDVAPNEVIRVAPLEWPGVYEVIECWRFRHEYRNLDELNRLVEAFFKRMRGGRTQAVLNRDPVAPG